MDSIEIRRGKRPLARSGRWIRTADEMLTAKSASRKRYNSASRHRYGQGSNIAQAGCLTRSEKYRASANDSQARPASIVKLPSASGQIDQRYSERNRSTQTKMTKAIASGPRKLGKHLRKFGEIAGDIHRDISRAQTPTRILSMRLSARSISL